MVEEEKRREEKREESGLVCGDVYAIWITGYTMSSFNVVKVEQSKVR